MSLRPSATPAEVREAYLKGTREKGKTNYRKGVMRTTVSPTQLAAQKIDKMRDGFNRAIDSGKTAAGLNAITNPMWQQAASGKGAENYVNGTNAGADKLLAARQAKQSQIDALRSQIDSMPNNTFEERMARQRAWAEGSRQIWGTN